MSSTDHRQSGNGGGQPGTKPGQGSGLNTQFMPFSGNAPVPADSPYNQSNQFSPMPPADQILNTPDISPKTTNALIDPASFSNMRQLEEMETGSVPVVPAQKNTAKLREPMLIPRTWGKRTESIRPPKGRRLVIHAAVTSFLIIIMMGTLLAVLQTGSGVRGAFTILKPDSGTASTRSNNTALIETQAATATAVTQDGYDPGVNTGQYAGIPGAPSGFDNTSNHFYYGQCTFWAAMHYHDLTGLWIPWYGNANQWVAGAIANGWIVSNTPKLHSIIVMQAGIQGAGYYGHVAVVEKINPDGSIDTSNWNWAGNWAITTTVSFRPGYGINFVYAPGT